MLTVTESPVIKRILANSSCQSGGNMSCVSSFIHLINPSIHSGSGEPVA